MPHLEVVRIVVVFEGPWTFHTEGLTALFEEDMFPSLRRVYVELDDSVLVVPSELVRLLADVNEPGMLEICHQTAPSEEDGVSLLDRSRASCTQSFYAEIDLHSHG